jgi:hypothetical protein
MPLMRPDPTFTLHRAWQCRPPEERLAYIALLNNALA